MSKILVSTEQYVFVWSRTSYDSMWAVYQLWSVVTGLMGQASDFSESVKWVVNLSSTAVYYTVIGTSSNAGPVPFLIMPRGLTKYRFLWIARNKLFTFHQIAIQTWFMVCVGEMHVTQQFIIFISYTIGLEKQTNRHAPYADCIYLSSMSISSRYLGWLQWWIWISNA